MSWRFFVFQRIAVTGYYEQNYNKTPPNLLGTGELCKGKARGYLLTGIFSTRR